MALLVLLLVSWAPAAYSQCSTFEPAYPGLNGPVRALGSWTPGGTGPQLPHLVAGGAFTWNEGQGSQDYIAWWDGAAWSNFGWGTDGPVNAITTWDPDGDGPLTPQVVIGGEFVDVGADSTGGITANYIVRWDGVAWQPLGTGADGPVDVLDFVGPGWGWAAAGGTRGRRALHPHWRRLDRRRGPLGRYGLAQLRLGHQRQRICAYRVGPGW